MEEVILKNKELIERIVTSKSCSSIPRELMDAVVSLNEKNGNKVCKHCPSSLYRAFQFAKKQIDNYGCEEKRRKKGKNKERQSTVLGE